MSFSWFYDEATCTLTIGLALHYDVMSWKHFLHYYTTKGQQCGDLMLRLLLVRASCWAKIQSLVIWDVLELVWRHNATAVMRRMRRVSRTWSALTVAWRHSNVFGIHGNIFRVTGHLCGEHWWGWWFETPSRPLWPHSNVNTEVGLSVIVYDIIVLKYLHFHCWIEGDDEVTKKESGLRI